MFACTVVLFSPGTPSLPFEHSRGVLLALSVPPDISCGQSGRSRCSWICCVAFAKEEPTTCVVLGLQCFLHCKSFQLICTSGAPGDVPRDDLYLPLADTALRAT